MDQMQLTEFTWSLRTLKGCWGRLVLPRFSFQTLSFSRLDIEDAALQRKQIIISLVHLQGMGL